MNYLVVLKAQARNGSMLIDFTKENSKYALKKERILLHVLTSNKESVRMVLAEMAHINYLLLSFSLIIYFFFIKHSLKFPSQKSMERTKKARARAGKSPREYEYVPGVFWRGVTSLM